MERKRSSLRTLTLEELEKVAGQTFQQIINEEIILWRAKNNVVNACAPVCKKVLQSFRMLEKNIEKGLAESRKSSGSEILVLYMRSAQVPVNEISDNYPSRTSTENDEIEDHRLSSTIRSYPDPIVAKEALGRPNNDAEENSPLYTKVSPSNSFAQVPVNVDNQTSKGTKNDRAGDTRLLITDPSSVRSAQVHLPDEELEMLRMRIEKEKGEDAQLFTKGKYNVVLFLFFF